MIDRFLNPFLRVFLENKLETPNRMFDFVMKMFSEGDATSRIREEIPKQLAIQLPADTFFVQYKVVDIRENTFYQLGC
jgi:hypothetical protein